MSPNGELLEREPEPTLPITNPLPSVALLADRAFEADADKLIDLLVAALLAPADLAALLVFFALFLAAVALGGLAAQTIAPNATPPIAAKPTAHL